MTAAIFGLLGVIVGGVVTAGAEVALRRRQEQREARLALRMLSDEMISVNAWIGIWLDNEDQPNPPIDQLKTTVAELVSVWREHRTALADLDHEAWRTIATAVWGGWYLPKDPGVQSLQALRLAIETALGVMPDEIEIPHALDAAAR